ncbi:MAG: site-2 protease family protein [Sandaracinaceae bacterium]|nr:site-2 protease family protein [Sandaracinaceae bacterium]
MDFTPLNVTFAILGISLLVVIHEAGHYLAARAFGMRVLKFSIGLGKPIWKYQPKGSPTTFQVCMVPLLAYVQIDGMNPADDVDPKDPELYPNKGVFGRIVTIFAGPFANYLAASLMIFVLAQVGGLPEPDTTNRVAMVTKGSPAQIAKLRQDDRVIEVDGHPVADYEDLVAANHGREGQPTPYVVLRDGERLTLMLTPTLREFADGARPVIGIQLASERVFRTHSMEEAGTRALSYPLLLTIANLEGIAQLIRQPDPSQVKSVVGMTKMLSDSIRIAPQQYVWYLILISIALGLFNLLPVPALDGGRLAFLAYEVITRRRANERVEAAVHTVGLLFLLGVLALVMVRDVIDLT